MRVLLLLFLFVCFTPAADARSDIFSARKWEPGFQIRHSSRFEVDSTDHSALELHVFTCILSAEDLQFRRSESGQDEDALYYADYELTLEILTGKGKKLRSVASRYAHKELEYGRIPRKEDLEQHKHSFQLFIEPGIYSWWVELQDLNSRRRFRKEGRFEVLDLREQDFALSELWLLSDVDSEHPDPMLAQPFQERKGGSHPENMTVYYEVWHREGGELNLSSRIEDRRGNLPHDRQLERTYPQGVSQNILRVPIDELGSGDYRIWMELLEEGAKPTKERRILGWRDKGHRNPVQSTATFSVRWNNNPGTPVELDRSIEQLRYIIPNKRFKELADSPMDRKLSQFEGFWKSVDPSPDTEENELMREYYRRAEFADRRFSWSRFPGWRSDRGRIYMIYGDPDKVERSEGNMDEVAWERWYYEELGREYLFVDRQGFGDYLLLLDPRY